MVEIAAAALIVLVLAGQAALVAHLRGRQPARAQTPTPPPLPAAPPAVNPNDGPLVALLRRNRWLRRTLSVGSTAAILVAVGIVGYPFYTNLQAERLQGRLRTELDSDELQQDYAACQRAGFDDPSCEIREGDSLTRIVMPDIHVDVVVVEGTSAGALRAGAGHYSDTPLPCEAGNVSIAGHRTTYGRPFNNVDQLHKRTELSPGSTITLKLPIDAECTYEVTDIFIVSPNDTSVIEDVPGENTLTLTTCHPKNSAAQRLIVRAQLVGEPLGTPSPA